MPMSPHADADTSLPVSHSGRKRAAKSAMSQAVVVSPASTVVKSAPCSRLHDPHARHAAIAEAAYYRAEQRGFAPGCELSDWLAAEAGIDVRTIVA